MELEDLEYILDHYKAPRNKGELKDPDISYIVAACDQIVANSVAVVRKANFLP